MTKRPEKGIYHFPDSLEIPNLTFYKNLRTTTIRVACLHFTNYSLLYVLSLSATPIFEGQLVSENPLTGYEFDFKVKKSNMPIGYAAYFKLLNGYEATLYMTIEELKEHGKKYSKTFNNWCQYYWLS